MKKQKQDYHHQKKTDGNGLFFAYNSFLMTLWDNCIKRRKKGFKRIKTTIRIWIDILLYLRNGLSVHTYRNEFARK